MVLSPESKHSGREPSSCAERGPRWRFVVAEVSVPPGSLEHVQRDNGGFPRNLGDPVVSTRPESGVTGLLKPSLTNSRRYRQAKETKRGETGGGES